MEQRTPWPEGLVIRRAERRDLPALGRLGAALLRLHHGFDRKRFMAPGKSPEDGYAWFLGTQFDEHDAVVLVAERERDRAVVGYVYASIEPRSWKELRDQAGFVHDLVVEAEARGAGIGAALLEAGTEWLRSRGAPRVVLWTADQNEGAQRLFARAGFRRTMIEMTKELG